MTLHIATGRIAEAEALIRRYHYAKTMPGAALVVTWHEPGGLFGDLGPAVAACVFGNSRGRWSETVYELVRLVRRDDLRLSLTALIAVGVRLMRSRCDLLVSFADATQGHHGGIYQAASWNYDGQRERCMDGVIIGGKFIAGRYCNDLYGTRSPDRLRERGIIAEPHYDEGKHLYWKALNRDGAKKAARLGLKRMPYPKPAHAKDVAA